MRRIAALVVDVLALEVEVLMYMMGRGRVVSRGRGKGSPETYVLMVPEVIMTRRPASGKKLTEILAIVTIGWNPIQKGLVEHGKPRCGLLEIGIGVFTGLGNGFHGHNDALIAQIAARGLQKGLIKHGDTRRRRKVS